MRCILAQLSKKLNILRRLCGMILSRDIRVYVFAVLFQISCLIVEGFENQEENKTFVRWFTGIDVQRIVWNDCFYLLKRKLERFVLKQYFGADYIYSRIMARTFLSEYLKVILCLYK